VAYHVFIERAQDDSPAGIEQLAKAIAERYGLPGRGLAQRLAVGRYRIRDNLDRATATQAAVDLESLGAVCTVEAEGRIGNEPSSDRFERVGEVLDGRYRLGPCVATGGVGIVYEAEHLQTGQTFAVKLLPPGGSGYGELRRRFEREAKTISLLDHPNIVEVFDFAILKDGTLFLVMELLRGRSLAEVVTGQAMPARWCASIARQILGALVCAHGVGVIHRDLRPANVMLLADDVVKLLDFGIVRLLGEAAADVGSSTLTRRGSVLGSPWYMAPEQVLGNKVDARADLYALGVILFEMLSGRKLFEDPNPRVVQSMHISTPAPTLSDAVPHLRLSAPLVALVARALVKRPDDRFASAAEMLDALDRGAAKL
jgi:serine/threonine-protein kinase